MGRSELRIVVVPKPVTVALLALATAAIASLVYWLSGRAYVRDSYGLRTLIARLTAGHSETTPLLAALMPVFAAALLFLPWGFFAFLSLDRGTRLRTYFATFLATIVFVSAIAVWQSFLPTRVLGVLDAASAAAGALLGAAAGHMRKELRVRFEP